MELEYDLKSAHRMVREQKALGWDVAWEGWDIIFYRPSPYARTQVEGVFRKGRWQFANRFAVGKDGIYRIDPRNIKDHRNTKRSRRPRT